MEGVPVHSEEKKGSPRCGWPEARLCGRQLRNGRAIMKSSAGFTKLMTKPTISYMVTNR